MNATGISFPRMTVVLLIRHALTDMTGKRLAGTLPGVSLSDHGRKQAEALAARLGPMHLSAVYSSPVDRCIETAHAIAGVRGLEVRPAPGLEEVGYGRWIGRPLAQLARTRLWSRIHQVPSSVRFPAGETLREVQQRGVTALDAIAASHSRGAVAAVSHADVIRLLLAHYAGIHIDLFQRIIVSTASVSAVSLGDGPPRILRINDTGSLGDLIPGPRRRTAP